MKSPFTAKAAAITLALISLALYYPSVKSGFVNWDDPQYVTQNAAELSAPLFSEFKKPSHGYYHPLTILSYKLDYRAGGLSPSVYHYTNVLLHTSNTALLLMLAAALGVPLEAAFLAALLFCAHPLMSEPVLWISGRKDLLLCFFGLASLLLYAGRNAGRANFALANIAAALAMLSKPTAVTIPLLFVLLDFYRVRKPSAEMFVEKLPLLAAGALVILLSVSGAKPLLPPDRPPSDSWLGAMSALNNIWFYYAKLVWPAGLAAEYPYAFAYGMKNLFWQPAGAIAVSALLFYSGKAGALGAGFFLAAVLPVIARPDMAVADRYVYFPACGLFIAAGHYIGLLLVRAGRLPENRSWIAEFDGGCRDISLQKFLANSYSYSLQILRRTVLGIHRLGSRNQLRFPGLRKAVFVAPLAIAAVLAVITAGRRAAWADNVSLWRDVYSKYPCADDAAANYSGALLEVSDFAGTASVHDEALRCRAPLSAGALDKIRYNAGLAAAKSGDAARARELFGGISSGFEDYHQALNNLGIISAAAGEHARARAYFTAALKLRPDYETAKRNLKLLSCAKEPRRDR
ncbi:MAG: hypothetical protein PHP45_00325 [Elusimicrobiales bacterium]|nr:hypothetical protein [Elusimicrobiales bacterium]